MAGTTKKTKMVWVKDRAVAVHKATGAVHMISGAILMLVANSDFVKKSEFLQKTWWMLPAIMLIVGIILYRKGSKYGPALLVAGAMLFVLYYQQQKAKEAAQSPASGDTKGVESEVTNNGMRWRLEPNGTVTMLGPSSDTGATSQHEIARNMAEAVFRRAA